MSDYAPSQPPLYIRVACALAVVLVPAAIYWAADAAIKDHHRKAEAQANERVLREIADFRNCRGDFVYVRLGANHGGFAMLEAFNGQADSGDGRAYKMAIWYSQNVDDFLEQVAGGRGLASLDLLFTDVSDAGLDVVATLPDLKELSVYGGKATDARLEELRTQLPGCRITVKAPE